MGFEVRSVAKYIRMSPRKARLVADLVKGMEAEKALAILEHVSKAAAAPIAQAIRSALANAEENYGLSRADMYIKNLTADEGPTLKRGRIGARSRFKPVHKRTTHITVVLDELES